MTYPVLNITPETTAQEVFEAVGKHLHLQGKPSTGPSFATRTATTCKYRSPEGLACAVGCLLTDEEAAAADNLGDSNIRNLRSTGLLPQRLLPHFDLLCQLQYLHDREPSDSWDELLIDIIT